MLRGEATEAGRSVALGLWGQALQQPRVELRHGAAALYLQQKWDSQRYPETA